MRCLLVLLLSAPALAQTNMTGGELSELHHSRAGHPAYINGFETQLNFLTMKEGAVTLSPGSYYVANTKNNGAVRLQNFVYSEDDTYILEFGHEYCRFFRGHGQVGVISGEFTIIEPVDLIPPFGSSSSAVYEIATTYDGNDLDELSFYNSADTLYIDHPDYFPARLVRYATADWQLNDIDANDGPFLTQNVTEQTITPDDVTGTIALSASGDALWAAGHVNSYWQISHITDANTESGSITGTGATTRAFIGSGATYTVTVSGTFDATIALQQSFDGTTYQNLRNITSAEEITNTTDEPQFIRLNCTTYASGTATWEIEVPSYTHQGVAQITAVTDPQNATATVISRLYEASATTRWAEGAWSTYRGFPAAVNFYAQRLVHGGTAWEPLRLWFSATPDIESHESPVEPVATDAFAYTISGARQNPIKWLEPRHGHGITIGTLGRIIEIQPIDTFAAISATNPPTETASVAWTSGNIGPVLADNVMLVTDRGGRRIGELLSSQEQESLVVADITRFADHITYVEGSEGLTDVAFQLRPEPILWAARSDGVMPAMTYDRLGQIGAWSRHTIGGSVEEVETVPLATYDELWIVGRYTVDSNTVRFVMYQDELDPRKTRDEFHYVHAGLIFDGGAAMAITGITEADPGVVTVSGSFPSGFADGHQIYLDSISGMVELNEMVYSANDVNATDMTFALRTADNSSDIDTTIYTTYTSDGNATWVENAFGNLGYLEGETLTAAGFGPIEAIESTTVSSGAVTLSDYYNHVHIGYFDNAVLQTTAFDTLETQDRLKQMDSVALTFLRTLGGDIGSDTSNYRAIQYETEDDGTITLLTGDKIMDISGNLDHKARVVIRQDEPLPMTISGIRPQLSVRGDF